MEDALNSQDSVHETILEQSIAEASSENSQAPVMSDKPAQEQRNGTTEGLDAIMARIEAAAHAQKSSVDTRSSTAAAPAEASIAATTSELNADVKMEDAEPSQSTATATASKIEDPAAVKAEEDISIPEAEVEEPALPEAPLETDPNGEWEVDSDPYESSSSVSTTSSEDSDDSDDDDDDYALLSPAEQARILMQEEGGSDNEGGESSSKQTKRAVRTVNEKPDEIIPKPDITVTPEMKIVELGKVETVVENMALIGAKTTGEYQVLESGSLLCLEDRSVIGVVADTLGRVQQPLYTVHYTNAKDLEESGIATGVNIYYVPQHSTFVFTEPLRAFKGSDASNLHDEEVGEAEMEFSDDEAEMEYKRAQKLKRKGIDPNAAPRGGRGRGGTRGGARGGRGGMSGARMEPVTELSYDDDGEGYTPLARPTNLHEMMNGMEAPVEERGFAGSYPLPPMTSERSNDAGRGGRGRDRGRGGRGGRGGDRGGRGFGGRGGGSRGGPNNNRHGDNQQRQQTFDLPPRPPTQDFSQQQQQSSSAAYQNQQSYNNAYPPQHTQHQQAPSAPAFNFNMPLLPPGSFVNPAFFPNVQQQPQQQAQQPQQSWGQNYAQPPNLSQISPDVLEVLRKLQQSQQQGGNGQ